MKKTTFALLLALFSPAVLATPDGGFHPDKAHRRRKNRTTAFAASRTCALPR